VDLYSARMFMAFHEISGLNWMAVYIVDSFTLQHIFFSERVIRVCKNLPAESKHLSSLLQFKAFINGTDLTQFVSLGF